MCTLIVSIRASELAGVCLSASGADWCKHSRHKQFLLQDHQISRFYALLRKFFVQGESTFAVLDLTITSLFLGGGGVKPFEGARETEGSMATGLLLRIREPLFLCLFMYQSIPSLNIPAGDPRGFAHSQCPGSGFRPAFFAFALGVGV